MNSVKIENLDWMTYQALTEQGRCRIILPVGAIEQHGPYQLHAPGTLMTQLDALLNAFVAQHRMKLPGSHYEPCYELVG